MVLRPYQTKITADVRAAWSAGAQNVLVQLSTGGGKTVIFGTIIREHDGYACAIAHRKELVGQMSLTLARLGARHNIIAPPGTIREISTRHMQEIGRSYYDPTAPVGVAGVDTLLNRDLGAWGKRVSLWVCDEGHHLLAGNKWGKALAQFPNARGLGVTATPERADGRGLGRHADGVFDVLVQGPPMRELIDHPDQYLCDYRVFAAQSDINVADIPLSAGGDYSPPALANAARRSHITGDTVDAYLRIAPGKLGVTFCVSVEIATETAARYRAAGVPAEMVSADTPELVRAAILRRFARRELLQLVNVDLFGEGFDLPAIEVVSMARPTASYPLFVQQFGRALRPMEGKDRAIIIDHVRNVRLPGGGAHDLPDAPRAWSLSRREKRAKGAVQDSEIKVRACPSCTLIYERFHRACPYCGHIPEPAARAAPEQVDGDLLELDPGILARLRRAGEAVMAKPPALPYGASPVVVAAIHKRRREMQLAQRDLRDVIATWAGWQVAQGRDDHESYRRFYLDYGVDVGTAQTLRTADANALRERIAATVSAAGIALPVATAPTPTPMETGP